jgi:hypothetical protein
MIAREATGVRTGFPLPASGFRGCDDRFWHKAEGRRLARMSAAEGSADIAKSVSVLDL